jgi:hypothetical protein
MLRPHSPLIAIIGFGIIAVIWFGLFELLVAGILTMFRAKT